jgi:hypothetical protein
MNLRGETSTPSVLAACSAMAIFAACGSAIAAPKSFSTYLNGTVPSSPPGSTPPPQVPATLVLDGEAATRSNGVALFGAATDVCNFVGPTSALCVNAKSFFDSNPTGVWQLTRDPEASTRAHLYSGGNLSNIVATTSVAAIVNRLNAGTSMILSYNGYSVPVCFSSSPQDGNVTINGITCNGSYKLDAPGSGTTNAQERRVANGNTNSLQSIINAAINNVNVGTITASICPVNVTNLISNGTSVEAVVAAITNVRAPTDQCGVSQRPLYAGGNMCGGSDTPSNPCLQDSPDVINTLMGSLAYAACGLFPSGICPTPTGPFTGDGYYSWYAPPCYFSQPGCAQAGNITSAVYSYGVMSVTGVTPSVGNTLLIQSSSLTPFKIAGPDVPDSNANFGSTADLLGDYVFQCLQNCSSVPSPGSPSKWIVTYPGDTSGNPISSEAINLNLPPAIVLWGVAENSVTNTLYTWSWLSIQQQGAANCCIPANGQVTGSVSGLVPQINSIGFATCPAHNSVACAADILGWSQWDGVSTKVASAPYPGLPNSQAWAEKAGGIMSDITTFMSAVMNFPTLNPSISSTVIPFGTCSVQAGFNAKISSIGHLDPRLSISNWGAAQSPKVSCQE